MLQEEIIDGVIFVAQTTFYVYPSAKDRDRGAYSCCTSDGEIFDRLKKDCRNGVLPTQEAILTLSVLKR